jgi:pyruvate dehydrogenase E2 component (dihydrolipoamide acetyltransferase)
MSPSSEVGVYEFRMPSLGADMESGTLLEWRVAPGDVVRRGDIVALVDTEKAEIEVEIFAAGTVEELVVREGAEVPVGTLLARVRTVAAPEPAGATPEPAPPARPARAAPPPLPITAAAPPPAVARVATIVTGRVETIAPGRGAAGSAGRGEAIAPPRAEAAAPRRAAAAAPAATAPSALAPTRERPPASPSARRRARQLGIDLVTVAGSGPSGAITRTDVETAAAEAAARAAELAGRAAAPATSTMAATATPSPRRRDEGQAAPLPTVPRRSARPGGLRRALAAAMERSNREIPHYYLSTEIDLQRARGWLDAANQQRSIADRILPAVLFLKAIALAAREVPELNGFWIDGAFRPGDGIHLGVAISRREGEVVVPAIRDVDAMSLDQLMAALRDLVRRARSGSLRSSELDAATLTVTNLGELGVSTVFGVIYPPQVALVGIGRIVDRPRAIDGMLAVRPAASLSLAADHRASDGYRGARFLGRIEASLQRPEVL